MFYFYKLGVGRVYCFYILVSLEMIYNNCLR